MSAPAVPAFRFRSILLPAVLPTLLFAIGEGAILPVLPAIATSRGAGLALAGLVAAMITVGQLLGDLPSGLVVQRLGESRTMLLAAAAAALGSVIAVLSRDVLLLTVGVLLLGVAASVFALARHAFMTVYVPLHFRSRALSTLAGMFRLGWLVGPFLGAALIHATGWTASVFLIQLALLVAVVVVLAVLPDPTTVMRRGEHAVEPLDAGAALQDGAPVEVEVEAVRHGLFATLREHVAVLLRLGGAMGILSALRATRVVIVPLWAVSLGLPETETSIIVGVAGAVDFALFYANGQIMDRWGRLAGCLPSTLVLGVALLGLAATHALAHPLGWFVALALLLAIGNGLGSGILLTLGADLAPAAHPAPFLGAWRFCGDAGSAAAPLALAGLTAVLSLPAAAAIVGAAGFVGAGMFIRWVPRYIGRGRLGS